MAHFAELDENNVVKRVVVISNEAVHNLSFPESEPFGVAFCQSLYGANTIWKQTSYNNNFRKHFAGIGATYRADIDAFIARKPEQFPSFVLNNEKAIWEPPYPRPIDGNLYVWNEATISWKVVPKPYPSWIIQIIEGNPICWIAPVPYPTDDKKYVWDESILNWVEVT